MSKVIWVFGPQHSGTRLFTCLIDRHPDVKGINHQSFPCGKDQIYENFSTNSVRYNLKECDYLVIVDRDNSCINKSNRKNISRISKNWLNTQIETIKTVDKDFYNNKIKYVSYELLVSYRKKYLKQILESMSLDTNKYDFNLEGKTHIPNNQFGELNHNATCTLKIMDGNAKYSR